MLTLARAALLPLKVLLLICFLAVPQLAAAQDTPETPPPAGASDDGYELGPGDQVKISVFNQDDLSGEYALDGKGRFSMPLVGSVEASGLTPSELESLLVDRLKPDYLVNPRVFIQVLNYRPYYLMGEVASTGAFPYVAGMTYLTAVAIAGGFTYRAKKDRVFVIRGNDPGSDEVQLEMEDRVQPGDIIRVAERLF